MRVLKVLKRNYVEQLKAQARASERIGVYATAKTFVDIPEAARLKTPITVSGPAPVLIDTSLEHHQCAVTDAKNAVVLHKFLGELSRVQASDERLWSYLTHVEFWNYVQWRWPVDPDAKNPYEGILRHWFASVGGLAALRRNAIARLWWAGELTYAPWEENEELERFKTADKYKYTNILLRTQQTYQDVMERSFGSNSRLRICLLDVIDRKTKDRAVDPFVRQFMIDINLLSSYRELGALPVDQLLQILDTQADRLLNRLNK